MADSIKTAACAAPGRQDAPSPHPVLEKVMLGRLVLLGALLAALSALAAGHSFGLYAVIGVAFLITIPYAAWLRNVETLRQSADNQFLLDTVIITGIIHFTGGIESDLCLLYPLVILAAGIVVSGDLAFRVALFGMIVYATLIILELGGMLPFPSGSLVPTIQFQAAIQTLMLRIVFFLFFAAATRFISDRVLVQDRELRRLRDIGQLLFDEVSAPLLAYFPNTRRIALGNEAASRLLGMSSEEIQNRLIDTLFEGAVPDPGDAPQAPPPTIWRMRRGDGTSFPALVETSTPRLPSTVASAFVGETGGADLAVIAFHDLGAMLDAEDGARLRTTAGVLAELAHSVGNPVTALRAAGEVLGTTAKLLGEGGKVSVRDMALIETMCTVIGDEAKKLDDKVAHFLDLATSDPERLRKLTDQAAMWADKLALNPETPPQQCRHGPAALGDDCISRTDVSVRRRTTV